MNLFISDVIEIPKFHWFIRSGGGVHRWGNAWKHISTDVRQNTPVDFRAFSVTRHLPSCKITAVIGLLHITHANEWVMKLFQFKSVRCVNLTNVQLTFYTWNQKRGKQENLFCIKLRCADKASFFSCSFNYFWWWIMYVFLEFFFSFWNFEEIMHNYHQIILNGKYNFIAFDFGVKYDPDMFWMCRWDSALLSYAFLSVYTRSALPMCACTQEYLYASTVFVWEWESVFERERLGF